MNKFTLITKYITVPGAMMRGVLEHISCKCCGIPVENNRLLQSNELFGHVEHELASNARKAFTISFVPAFINCIFALILLLPSVLSLFYFQYSSLVSMVVNIVAYYLAVSLMCNSYPLTEDMLNLKEKLYGKLPKNEEGETIGDRKTSGLANGFQKIIYAPGFAFLYVLSWCENHGFTFIFWAAVTVALAVFMGK